MTIKVAINRQIKGKADPSDKSAMSSLTYNYEVISMTCEELAEEIRAGHSFTSIFADENGNFHRKAEYFVSADIFAVDIDNKDLDRAMSFKEALEDPFLEKYAYLLYTTPSHTEEKNKFRIVFKPETPFTDKDEFTRVVSAFIACYGGDKACKDAGRFFYGSGEGGRVVALGNTIPDEEIMKIGKEQTNKIVRAVKVSGAQEDHMTSEVEQSELRHIGETLIKSFLRDLSNAVVGERNNKLNKASFSVAATIAGARKEGVELDEDFYRKTLRKIGLDLKLDVEEVERTIESGFAAGLEEPFSLISQELDYQNMVFRNFDPNDEDTFDPLLKIAGDYERGLAQLFAGTKREELIYNTTRAEWFRYQDGFWKFDEKQETKKEIPELLVDKYKVIKDHYLSKLRASEKDEQKLISSIIKICERAIKTVSNETTLKHVLSLTQLYLPKRDKDFDDNPLLLNLMNGTYDFCCMRFYEHRPKDYLTKITPVQYNPEATCPKWVKFLQEIFLEDEEMISFIQRLVGYCLTGLTNEQYLFFAYGTGANGKTTFFRVLQELLSDYYKSISIDTLTQRGYFKDNPQYQLSYVRKARVVVSTEVNTGSQLNESIVKQMTGNDNINSREIFKKIEEYIPEYKLFMCGNHKPQVSGNEGGIWRRITIIPFLNTIPKKDRRKMDDIIKEMVSELPGILNWAIEGFAEYSAMSDLGIPGLVNDAVEEYREDCDPLAEFIAEYIEKDKDHREKLKDITTSIKNYYQGNGQNPPFFDSKAVKKYFVDKGYQIKKAGHNIQFVYGVKLKPIPKYFGIHKPNSIEYVWRDPESNT